MRRILCNELIEVTQVSITLSMHAFWKNVSYEKFHNAAFFAREIVDDCPQVRISKNLCSILRLCC